MVVVDSSALIPLARVGRLDLVRAVFESVHTVEGVREEVLVEGKPGTAVLDSFLAEASVHPAPADAAEVSDLAGIAETDAAVVLLAREREDDLLANDKGLIAIARTHDVDSWWVTSLLLAAAKADVVDGETAQTVLYDLVDAGMNLDPTVFSRVHSALGDLDE